MNEIPRFLPAQKLNFIDQLVGYFSPSAGIERARARAKLSSFGGYEGGRRNRRGTQNWRPRVGNADADLLPDLPELRARSRDLARNMPIATGAIATVVTSVVGDGLRMQAAVDREALGLDDEAADAWERAAEREWKLFSRTADFSTVQTFEGLQALALRATLESGDVFAVRRFRQDKGDIYGTKLQILEADRVSNPKYAADINELSGGVEISGGIPRAYHVTNQHPGAIIRQALEWTRVAARTNDGEQAILHLFHRLRPEQTRGIPYLAPVIQYIKQLGDYSDAEVRAAVVSAMFTVFVTSNVDQTEHPVVGERPSGEGLGQNEVKLGSGAIVQLNGGEDVKFADPARPNGQFDPFFQAFVRQIGVALELPFELLVKHFTASYSASRAALDMAWQFFKCRRQWLGSSFCQVIYVWFLDEAIAKGRLTAPGYFDDPAIRLAYAGSRWIGPGRSTVDALKDAQADQAYLDMNIISREEIRAERYGDRGTWENLVPQLGREQQLRNDEGLRDPQAAAPGGAQQTNPDEANRIDAAGGSTV